MAPRTPFEKSLEFASLLGVILPFALTAFYWSTLPEQIPIHFDFEGRPDRWGSRAMMLMLPLSGLMSFTILSAIGSRTNSLKLNLPKGVDRNHPEVHRLARELISWTKTLVMGLLTYLSWGKIVVATGKSQDIATSVPIAVTVLIVAVVILYSQKMKRFRQPAS